MKAAPVHIPKRDQKALKLLSIYGYECPIAKSMGHWAECQEIHHALVHNTALNRKLYPRLMHSLWNLMPVNHYFHMNNGSFGIISQKEARSREDFLQRHPCIARVLNMEDDK